MWVPKSKTLKKHRKCKHNSCKWCIDIDSLIDQRRSLLWEKKCSSEIDSLLIELKTVTKIRWFLKKKFQLNVCWLITRMFIYNKQEITKRLLFPFIALDRMYYRTLLTISNVQKREHVQHETTQKSSFVIFFYCLKLIDNRKRNETHAFHWAHHRWRINNIDKRSKKYT